MKKMKDNDLIMVCPGDVERDIAFFNNAMGNSSGTYTEDLNNTGIVYHGSNDYFKEFKSPINWFSDSVEYAKEYALWSNREGYIYECKLNIRNPFDCGYTGSRVYSLIPSIPYKFSTDFQKIISKLNISEDEIRPIIENIGVEYSDDDTTKGFNMRIDVVVRSSQFRDLLVKRGYTCVIAREKASGGKLVKTYGMFFSKDIDIQKIVELARVGSGEVETIEQYNKPKKEGVNMKKDTEILYEIEDELFKASGKKTFTDRPLGREKSTGDEIHLYYFDKDNYAYVNHTKDKVYAYFLNGKFTNLKDMANNLKESKGSDNMDKAQLRAFNILRKEPDVFAVIYRVTEKSGIKYIEPIRCYSQEDVDNYSKEHSKKLGKTNITIDVFYRSQLGKIGDALKSRSII